MYLEFLDLQHHCRSHLQNAVDSALECMAPGLAVLYTVADVAHTASSGVNRQIWTGASLAPLG